MTLETQTKKVQKKMTGNFLQHHSKQIFQFGVINHHFSTAAEQSEECAAVSKQRRKD